LSFVCVHYSATTLRAGLVPGAVLGSGNKSAENIEKSRHFYSKKLPWILFLPSRTAEV
jgi:hypothetical protein